MLVFSVEREEIEEILQRSEVKESKNGACSRPRQNPVDRRLTGGVAGRLPDRSVCMTCTDMAWSIAQSTVAKERSTGAVDRLT